MNRKIISLFLAVSAAVSLLTGCGEAPVPYVSPAPLYVEYSNTSDTTTSVSDVSEYSTASESSTSFYSPSSTSSALSVLPIVENPQITASTTVTTSSVTPAQNTHHRPRVLDTKSEEFVAYTTGNAELNSQEGFIPYLYDFGTSASVGYSLSDTEHQLPVEADYGLKGVFDGSVAIIQAYDHTNKRLAIVSSYMSALDASVNMTIPWDFDESTQYCNAQGLSNGLYRMSVTFSNQTTSEIYFLVNGDEYLFCRMIIASDKTWKANQNISMIRARRTALNDLIKKYDITPDNSVDWNIIQYPYYNINGWRRDTDRWANLSDDITDPSWSDERKLYAICDWLSQNVAYDYYVSNVLHDNRSRHYNVLDGGQSVWNLRAGVCRDYGQILAIMCRKQGIPADVISTSTHIWNVVYINGRWIEVDICDTNRYSVSGEDTTKRNTTYNTYKNFLSLMGTDCSTNYGEEIRVWLYMGQCY